MEWLREENSDVEIRIFVQPRSSKAKIVGEHNGELKVAITSPPVDGKANKAVIALFAKIMRTAKGRIEISRGLTSRHKTVRVTGLPLAMAEEALRAAMT